MLGTGNFVGAYFYGMSLATFILQTFLLALGDSMKLLCTLAIALLVAGATDAVAQDPGSTVTDDQYAQVCGKLVADMQECVAAGVAAGIDKKSSEDMCTIMMQKQIMGCARFTFGLLGESLSRLLGK